MRFWYFCIDKFLNQNICCGYSKEPSRDGSYEHPKHMFQMMCKEKNCFYAKNASYNLDLNISRKNNQNTHYCV